MLKPVRTSAPAAAILSASDLKEHSRVDFDEEDSLITSYIEAATGYLDGYSGILGRALITQTWQQSYPRFSRVMSLPLDPVQSISSVTYYDTDNVQQTLSASNYSLYGGWEPFFYADQDVTLPSTYERPDAVTITFVAGYGDAGTDVPPQIRQAIKLMVAHWIRNREAAGARMSETPLGVEHMLSPYRRRQR